jgi:hypothetical protein
MNWLVLWKLSPVDRRGPLLRANTRAPDLPVVQYEMGSANLILSHYPEARRNFERAIEFSLRHFHSMIGMAYAISAADSGDNRDVAALSETSAVAPKYLEAHALLGYYYDQMKPIGLWISTGQSSRSIRETSRGNCRWGSRCSKRAGPTMRRRPYRPRSA